MKNKYLNILLLFYIVLCLFNCNKEDCLTNDSDLFGEWSGSVNDIQYKNDVIIQESANDARLILNTDNSGTLERYINPPPPFISEGYIDTIDIDFTFAYLPESQILDIIIINELNDSLQRDYTETYDVLMHTADSLHIFFSRSFRDTANVLNKRVVEWQMMRK